MFPLSLTTGYSVLALNCMKAPGGDPAQVASIAAATGLPGPFLSKIVNRLATQGLVKTRRGRSGGVVLARPANQITLDEIVCAVEGEGWDKGCFLGLRTCAVPEPDKHCPFHEFWLEEISRFRAKMASITLADLECFDPVTATGEPAQMPFKPGCPHNCGTGACATSPGSAPAPDPARE